MLDHEHALQLWQGAIKAAEGNQAGAEEQPKQSQQDHGRNSATRQAKTPPATTVNMGRWAAIRTVTAKATASLRMNLAGVATIPGRCVPRRPGHRRRTKSANSTSAPTAKPCMKVFTNGRSKGTQRTTNAAHRAPGKHRQTTPNRPNTVPNRRCPKYIVMLTRLGPGNTWASVSVS